MSSMRCQSGFCRRGRLPSAVIALAILASHLSLADGQTSPSAVEATATSPTADLQPPSVDTPAPTRYDGRTLAEWRERIKDLDFKAPDIGREVPGLLAICQDQSAPWFSRRQAALTLGRIGAPAQSAVPELIRLLSEPGDDPELSTELWAIKALALYGPLAADAAPALIAILQDETEAPLPRLATIEALGRIGPTEPTVLPAITRVLDAGIEADRRARSAPLPDPPPESGGRENIADTLERAVAAAEMLELFGGHAASATPALIRATAAHDVLLRRAAANTLGMIGPAADLAIPALADLVLFDDELEIRDLAARALGRIGPAAEPVLIQLLEDPDPDVRMRAASACRELRTGASRTAVAALTTARADSDPLVRIAALESLWAVSGDVAAVAPPAIAELANPDRDIRMRAVRLLESLGPKLDGWLPDLRTLADSNGTPAAQAASRVLKTLESESRKAGTANER